MKFNRPKTHNVIGLTSAGVFSLLLAACGSSTSPASSSASSTTLAKSVAAASAKTSSNIIIAEPLQSLGYLPLYIAQKEGYFSKRGLNVTVQTMDTSASGFVDAVLKGSVWGDIGGPEHDAYANVKGANLKSIANVVNISNNYLVARKGINTSLPLAQQLKGQKIAVSFYGGTPNVDLRYWLSSIGLTPGKNVTLVESAASSYFAAIKSGQVNYAVTSDPQLSQGVALGIWTEPIFDFAKWFGPYTYSTINVPEKTITSNPTQVASFVSAIAQGDNTAINNPTIALSVAQQIFVGVSPSILKASYDRAIADHMWAANAQQTDAAFQTDVKAITQVGTYQGPPINANSVIDNQFLGANNAG